MHRKNAPLSRKVIGKLVEQGSIALCVTDVDGVIQYVNAAFTQRSGYREEELIGRRPSMLQSGLTDPARYVELWQTILAGEVWRGVLVNRTKQGELLVERQVIAPIQDDDGRITHFAALKEDLSSLKASEAALERRVQLHYLLSACNQCLVRSRSEAELLHRLTRLLVDEGELLAAWIGLAEPGSALLRPAAVAVSDADRPVLAPDPASCAGAMQAEQGALRRERAAVSSEVVGAEVGVALAFGTPDGGCRGVLQLYAAAPERFDDEELALLGEFAGDLAFAIAGHRIRRELEENEARFRTIAEDSVAGIYMIRDGRFLFVNPHLAAIFGYRVEQLVGMAVADVVAPEDRTRVMDNLRKRVEGEVNSLHYELTGLRADGARVQVEVLGARSLFLGEPVVVGTLLDVTQRNAAETHMRLLSRAVDAASSGIAISDLAQPDSPFIYVNRAFETITGYPAAEVIGRNGRFLLGDDRQQPELAKLKQAFRCRKPAEVVLRNYQRNGSLFWNQFTVAPVNDSDGNTTHYISVIDDITERKNHEHQLELLANYDPLTGLANKSLLRDRICQGLIHAQRDQRQLALLILDLDRFKIVHQSLGVVGSDAVLQKVAQRLQRLAGSADTVARLGADEFAWLMFDQADDGQLALRAQQVMEQLKRPIQVGDDQLSLTASIGIALAGSDEQAADALLANAEAAMFKAAEERNCFRFYAPEMNLRARARLALESDLKRACEQGEFLLHYQPKVCLRSGRITGAEALLRWQHPERGLVPPNDFIPAAEETGLIGEMGRQALADACAAVAALNRELGLELSIAVNLSARQFGDESLVGHVAGVLAHAGLAPALLECELTESMLMADPESAQQLLGQLKALGVQVALDDFGTGYSSLSYLKRFPIDTIKIDRSFVRDVPADEHDMAIIRAIIALASSLGLQVVAEGVETAQQQTCLGEAGCDTMQGYLFSRPLPLAEFRQLLHDQRPD